MHVLVNNAGIQPPSTNKMLHLLPLNAWHEVLGTLADVLCSHASLPLQVLSVNLHGVYYATAAALPYMLQNAEKQKKKGAKADFREAPGVILNIGSVQVGWGEELTEFHSQAFSNATLSRPGPAIDEGRASLRSKQRSAAGADAAGGRC